MLLHRLFAFSGSPWNPPTSSECLQMQKCLYHFPMPFPWNTRPLPPAPRPAVDAQTLRRFFDRPSHCAPHEGKSF